MTKSLSVDWIAIAHDAPKHAYRLDRKAPAFRSSSSVCNAGPQVPADGRDKGSASSGSRRCADCRKGLVAVRIEKAERQPSLFGGSWGR